MFGHSTSFPTISFSLRPFRRSKNKQPKNMPAASTARDRAITRSITCTWPKSTKAAVARHSTTATPPTTILEDDAHPETPTPLLPSDSWAVEHESHQNSRQEAQEVVIKTTSPVDDLESPFDASEPLLCNETPINRVTSTLCVFSDSTTSHQAPGNCASRGPWLSSGPEMADNDATSTANLIIKRSKAFQSMLCDVPPVILISDDHAEECRRNDEIHFLSLCHDPYNIVEPSSDPSRIPHIVITPPHFQRDEQVAAIANNRIPVQDKKGSRQLTTPLLNAAVCRLHRYEELQQYWQEKWYSIRRSAYRPRWFQYCVERRRTERLAPSTSAIVSSLYRKLFLCSAIAASMYSNSFRCRWDDVEYAQSVEKPFKWSDPVEAFASFRRDVLRPYAPEGVIVTVLARSEHPFTACDRSPSAIPDIAFVIESVPVDDLSEEAQRLMSNYVPEQDDQEGTRLIVDRILCTTDKDSFMEDESSDSETEPPSTPLQRVTTTYFTSLGESDGDEDDGEAQIGWHDYSPIIEARRAAQENQLLDSNLANDSNPSKFFLSTIDEDADDEDDYDEDEYGYSYEEETRGYYDDDNDDDDSLPDIETDEWFVQHRRLMEERQSASSLS